MGKAVVKFDEDSMQLPAHLAGAFGAVANNELSGGVSVGYPIISYKGKTWSLNEGKNRNVIMRPDSDDEPATYLEVVIVKANPALSKVYYQGGYTEGSDAKPDCFSNNGLVPDAAVAQPQCSNCAACPMNTWGSRITDNGSKGKACADSRRLAVVPNGDLSRAMLLRIPAATLKDLAGYSGMLTKRNAPYQAVVTKIAFDPSVAHPKMTFKAVRWLDADEAKAVSELMLSDTVKQIVGIDDDATPRLNPPAQTVAPAPAKVIQKATGVQLGKPKPVAAPVQEAEVVSEPEAVAVQPAPKKAVGFSTKAVAPKPEPQPSKVASKLAEASNELDAALAGLDDLD